jgi:hypothetical protein
MSEDRQSMLDTLARDMAQGGVSRRTALRRFLGFAVGASLAGPLDAIGFEGGERRCPKSRRCGKKCCPQHSHCKKGRCKCSPGFKKCGKKCVDLKADPRNCGACGVACEPGQSCVAGVCTSSQQPGAVCGNGVIEAGEQCDGANLGGQTCQGLGFTGGTLACGPNCTFVTSGCTGQGPVCGNGVVEADEQCDGSDLGGHTCQGLGFTGGTLACGPSCTFDTSGCTSPECAQASDCPGTNTQCKTKTCNAGVCDFAFAPLGTPVSCSGGTGTICDGSGNMTQQSCGPYTCSGTACGTSCNGNGDCTPPATCQSNTCITIVDCSSSPNGTPCDDGNACTVNDTCQGGACVGSAVSCTALDECHVAGVCNPANGTCSNPARPNGTPCTGGTCQGGVCTP